MQRLDGKIIHDIENVPNTQPIEIGELDSTSALLSLLCIIHRDGGQYIKKHGLKKSYQDAIKIVVNHKLERVKR